MWNEDLKSLDDTDINLECHTCESLSKVKVQDLMQKKKFKSLQVFSKSQSSPYLPTWIMVPHECFLVNLKIVERCYRDNWISEDCYDKWMAINGGNYQLGKGGYLNYLWEDRMLDLNQIETDYQQQCLLEAKINYCIILIVKCPIHKEIFHVIVNRNNAKGYSRNDYKMLNKLFPFDDDTDKNHTNIDLTSLVFELVKAGRKKEINEAFKFIPLGIANPMATLIMINYIGNQYCTRLFKLMKKDKICCIDTLSMSGYFKAISIAIRRTSLWPEGSVASLNEITGCSSWELAIGRHSRISNWDEEYHHRVEMTMPLKLPLNKERSESSNNEWILYAKPLLKQIISEIMPRGFNWPTFNDFCKNRHSWLSSGSAGAKYIHVDDKKYRLNRRGYMETIPIEEMTDWLNDEPMINAIASEKYEMGKARAIYGTETKDQAIMSYLLTIIEPRLSFVEGIESGLSGLNEIVSVIRRMRIVKRDREECTMLDYTDFNAQHTLEIQAEIFYQIQQYLEGESANPDAIKCAKWSGDACLNQWVKFPHLSKSVKVVRGLFSGNRATNFINTLLNRLYYDVAVKWIQEYLIISPIDPYRLHQGDDVWVSNGSRLWAEALYKVLNEMGLEFSDKKQIQDQNKAEFLRVTYTEDGAQGILARTISTLIEKPLQSDVDISPTSRSLGLNSQIMTCFRRNLSEECCTILWDAIVRYSLKSKIDDVSEVTIPYGMVCRSTFNNGMDIGPPSTRSKRAETIPKLPNIEYKSKILEENVNDYTSKAFIEVMSGQIKEEFLSENIKKELHITNVSDSMPQSDKVKALIKLHKKLNLWKLKTKDFKPTERIKIDDDYLNDFEFDLNLVGKIDFMFDNWQWIKEVRMERNMISAINVAITQSPYKDIATARRAHKLGILDAIKLCITSCKFKNMATEAMLCVESIKSALGDEITIEILDNLKGFGPTFEYKFGPVVVSWLMDYAVEKAVQTAMINRIKNVNEMKELLFETYNNTFLTALKDNRLTMISKY